VSERLPCSARSHASEDRLSQIQSRGVRRAPAGRSCRCEQAVRNPGSGRMPSEGEKSASNPSCPVAVSGDGLQVKWWKQRNRISGGGLESHTIRQPHHIATHAPRTGGGRTGLHRAGSAMRSTEPRIAIHAAWWQRQFGVDHERVTASMRGGPRTCCWLRALPSHSRSHGGKPPPTSTPYG